MQEAASAEAVAVKQRIPGAQLAVEVVISEQVDVPEPETVAQTLVAKVEVTEQTRAVPGTC